MAGGRNREKKKVHELASPPSPPTNIPPSKPPPSSSNPWTSKSFKNFKTLQLNTKQRRRTFSLPTSPSCSSKTGSSSLLSLPYPITSPFSSQLSRRRTRTFDTSSRLRIKPSETSRKSSTRVDTGCGREEEKGGRRVVGDGLWYVPFSFSSYFPHLLKLTWVSSSLADAYIQQKNGLSSISSLLAHRQPPTLLLPSLPVELLSEITTYLEHEDKLDLALVCFRFFDLLAHELYSRVNLYADDARKFAAAKVRPSFWSLVHSLD